MSDTPRRSLRTRCPDGVAATWLDAGIRGDPHPPELRRAMAATLARLVGLCRPLKHTGLESGSATPEGGLWREPHDARFDFDATTRAAEWIDALAVRTAMFEWFEAIYNRWRLHSTNGNRPPAEYEAHMSQPRPIGEAINKYVRTLKPKELISP